MRSTFLVYPIARIGRSLEGDRLCLFIFGIIFTVSLMGWGLGAIVHLSYLVAGTSSEGLKSDILGKATA